jgi:hypothetical protein
MVDPARCLGSLCSQDPRPWGATARPPAHTARGVSFEPCSRGACAAEYSRIGVCQGSTPNLSERHHNPCRSDRDASRRPRPRTSVVVMDKVPRPRLASAASKGGPGFPQAAARLDADTARSAQAAPEGHHTAMTCCDALHSLSLCLRSPRDPLGISSHARAFALISGT